MTTEPGKATPKDHSTLMILAFSGMFALFVLSMVAYGAWRLTRPDDGVPSGPPDAIVTTPPTLAAGDSAAALVNGVPIGRSAVDERRPLLTLFQVSGVDPADERAVVEWLVEQELIRQEAAARRIGPTGADLTTYIEADQRAFVERKSAGALEPATLALLDGLAQAGHPLEAWQDDPLLRVAYRDLLLVGYLERDMGESGITSGLDGYRQLVDGLRAKAKIEVMVD